MIETVMTYLVVGVACAVALLNVIAPLTKSSMDNKALDLLRKLEDLMLKVLLPQLRITPPQLPPNP